MIKLNDIKNSNFPLVQKYKIWFIVPAAILVLTIIFFAIYAIIEKNFAVGMNIGLDFTGGSAITVPLGEKSSADYNEICDAIDKIVMENGCDKPSYHQLQGNGADAAVYIRYKNAPKSYLEEHSTSSQVYTQEDVNNEIKKAVEAKYAEYLGDDYVQVKFISATASSDLIKSAILSIILTILVMLFYIFIRFEVVSGISAVVALLHDVAMIICFTIIFHIQVNSTFIAAIITVVAYSVNNTIVVFDRIREHKNIFKTGNKNITEWNVDMDVNKAAFETFTRSMYSAGSTLLVVVLLAIFGGEGLTEFILPLIFGLVAGIYSSLVIATSLYAILEKKEIQRYGSTTTTSGKKKADRKVTVE
jgi:preprotein translocase SecF subunit